MMVYLVSAQAGDAVPGGIDIALMDGVQALEAGFVQEWMAAQGYGPDDPGECMYLAAEVPDGFPHLQITLYAEDIGKYRAAVANRLRQYRDLDASREGLVRAAAAVNIPKRQIALMSGLSRQTVYNILGEHQ
jgi:hypothetical protein